MSLSDLIQTLLGHPCVTASSFSQMVDRREQLVITLSLWVTDGR